MFKLYLQIRSCNAFVNEVPITYFSNSVRGLTTHIMDRILVTEPVGPFYLYKNASEKSVFEVWMFKTYSIVHMPSPIIFSHVLKVFFIECLRSTGCNRSTHPQSGVNTSLQKLLAHVLTIRNRRHT